MHVHTRATYITASQQTTSSGNAIITNHAFYTRRAQLLSHWAHSGKDETLAGSHSRVPKQGRRMDNHGEPETNTLLGEDETTFRHGYVCARTQ